MILTAVSFLEERPDPTREEVRLALGGNMCRCTGYQKIVEAVLAAANRMKAKPMPFQILISTMDVIGNRMIQLRGSAPNREMMRLAVPVSFGTSMLAHMKAAAACGTAMGRIIAAFGSQRNLIDRLLRILAAIRPKKNWPIQAEKTRNNSDTRNEL